jgi:hypothetical protein
MVPQMLLMLLLRTMLITTLGAVVDLAFFAGAQQH